VNWLNSVIIFDEAHNLEGVASDAASAELSSLDIAGAIAELDRVRGARLPLTCALFSHLPPPPTPTHTNTHASFPPEEVGLSVPLVVWVSIEVFLRG
jgi:Rad3-related DNA helicase